jgi:hypothetical protein
MARRISEGPEARQATLESPGVSTSLQPSYMVCFSAFAFALLRLRRISIGGAYVRILDTDEDTAAKVEARFHL